MPSSLLLKDMPDDLKRRLHENAERNRRSMVQEAMVILDRALPNLGPVEFPKKLLNTRKPLTTEYILKAIRSGRK